MIFRHITIKSAHLEESVKFYQDICGLTIQAELRGKGPNDIVFLANAAGQTCVEIIDEPASACRSENLSMGFEVEDVEAYREQLAGRGMAVSPMISPNPATEFFFTKDPNGIDIQFINK